MTAPRQTLSSVMRTTRITSANIALITDGQAVIQGQSTEFINCLNLVSRSTLKPCKKSWTLTTAVTTHLSHHSHSTIYESTGVEYCAVFSSSRSTRYNNGVCYSLKWDQFAISVTHVCKHPHNRSDSQSHRCSHFLLVSRSRMCVCVDDQSFHALCKFTDCHAWSRTGGTWTITSIWHRLWWQGKSRDNNSSHRVLCKSCSTSALVDLRSWTGLVIRNTEVDLFASNPTK